MESPRIPADEAARLTELRRLAVLEREADPRFDDISELTRRLAGTEIGIVSLVDGNRQWFKSCVGASLGQREMPREISFCGHTILQRGPLIIADTLADPRFADSPLVLGDPHVRFYAGFPLITARGFVVGSLCAISRKPHHLSESQIDSLRRLASLTVQQLEHRRDSSLRAASSEGLAVLETLLRRDQLQQMLELMCSLEVGTPFTLLRCNYRDYERVNANLGGVVAEQYLNEAARRLLAAMPRSASVARFADGELVALLPLIVAEGEVRKIAERVLGFASHAYRSGHQSLPIDLSIGIAIQRGSYLGSDAMLADTSIAVRMARRLSGNAYRIIDIEARQEARARYRLESEFREAVLARQLEPFLQAIVDLESGDPMGFEALARWPRGTHVELPANFMPLAKECGLSGEVDLLIIEKALAALPQLARQVPRREMRLSCNLSGLLLGDAHLRSRLLALLDDHPCPPGWQVQVELLEDIIQDTSPEFAGFLDALVERKVRIAIDDFGTGYSSLARLISLPIHAVKVDQAFVNKIGAAADSPRILLRTMLTMLVDLGLEITAEGVESQQEREWLLRHGARKAQGYLFARPVPISDAIAAATTEPAGSASALPGRSSPSTIATT
jgi:EAL domain-containing protein (putative c-di-GMP-specific phosphodiesterase class I)/GAF domain-containing protein